METFRILVCGTRKKGYSELVENYLTYLKYGISDEDQMVIVEGCCPDSADEYAEKWAEKNHVKVNHYPSTSGNYLKRNIEMVESGIFRVVAFWDGFSYGTAHAIASAIFEEIPVKVIRLK
jgi:hypothetical protein